MTAISNAQISIFDLLEGVPLKRKEDIYCKIFDWRSSKSQTYISVKGVK